MAFVGTVSLIQKFENRVEFRLEDSSGCVIIVFWKEKSGRDFDIEENSLARVFCQAMISPDVKKASCLKVISLSDPDEVIFF